MSYPYQQQMGYMPPQSPSYPNQTMYAQQPAYTAPQQSFYGNPVYGQPVQQASSKPVGPTYPEWFAQVAGITPNEVERILNQEVQNYLHEVYRAGFGNYYQQDVAHYGAASQDMASVCESTRRMATVLILNDRSKSAYDHIRAAAANAVFGDIAIRIGGAQSPIFRQVEMVLNIGLNECINNYLRGLNDDQLYMGAVNANAPRQPQTSYYGGPANVNPNLFPGEGHTYHQQPQYQKPKNDLFGVGELHGGNTSGKGVLSADDFIAMTRSQPSTPKAPEPVVQQQQPVVDQHTRLKGVYGPDEFRDVMSSKPAEPSKPKAVIPSGWGLGEPAKEYTELPKTGIPPVSTFKFGAGEPIEDEDYTRQPTKEEFQRYSAAPTSTMNDHILADDDDFDDVLDDAYAHATHQQEAAEQSYLERVNKMNEIEPTVESSQKLLHVPNYLDHLSGGTTISQTTEPQPAPKTPSSSLTELLEQAKEPTRNHAEEGGREVATPRLSVGYMNMSPSEREALCRDYRLRVIPAILRGRDKLVRINVGGKQRVEIERSDSVIYEQHETESLSKTKVLSPWDIESQSRSATSTMATAANGRAWSETYFVDKLNEKLEAEGNEQTAEDIILGDLIADRQIIEIEDPVVSETNSENYQNEITRELTDRGVDGVGLILDMAVVNYMRLESTQMAYSGLSKKYLEKVHAAETVDELADALHDFKHFTSNPVRDIATMLRNLTKQVNYFLASEYGNGWSIDDAVADIRDLNTALSEYIEESKDELAINTSLFDIYKAAINISLNQVSLEEDEDVNEEDKEIIVAVKSNVTLLPFYYSDYPITFVDHAGAIRQEDHPELYELLNRLASKDKVANFKLVTLDNVALTFVRSLSDDGLFFLVDVK